MLFHCLGMVLLSLHAAEALGSPQKLPQILASPGESVTINCSLPAETIYLTPWPTWYKEQQDRSLQKIKRRNSKYPITGSKLVDQANLNINHAQRNDSGVYYCALNARIMSGTILVVSDAQSPGLSIFLPSSLEGAQPNHSLPFLCLFFNVNPSGDMISWDAGGETSQEDQTDVGMIDEEGVFSIWSLKLIPPERWIPGTSYTCPDQGNRSISAVIPTNPMPRGLSILPEKCFPILYFGIPCMVVLLSMLLLILFFRKCLLGGKVKKPAHEITMRQIPQTEYAELRCNR